MPTIQRNTRKRNRIPSELIDQIKIFCYLERKRSKTFKKIGESINRDHSTVIFHCKDVEFLFNQYPDFRETLADFSYEKFLPKLYKSLRIENAEKRTKNKLKRKKKQQQKWR